MPTYEEMLEALGEMWTERYGELELKVNCILTEPTCPTAIIKTERRQGPMFRADCDTIEEAIRTVVRAAYITLVERKPKPDTFPFDNLDSEKRVRLFLKTLDANADAVHAAGLIQ
jgi:hypothetical protein